MLDNIVNIVILSILSVKSLLDVIIMTGILPENRFTKILYDNYQKVFISKTTRSIHKKISPMLDEKKGHQYSRHEKPEEYLISLLSRYVCLYPNNCYGVDTKSKSDYYINMLDASLNKEDLDDMEKLIYELISFERKDRIDFIITPKNGNTILAKCYSDLHRCVPLFWKSESNSSKVIYTTIDEMTQFPNQLFVNFEGSSHLNFDRSKKLRGIVLDCNCSGGKGLLNSMDEFNRILKENDLLEKVELVKEAYVLFRSDIQGENIDLKFEHKDCSLKRYFDLDEEMKKRIYESKYQSKNGKYLSPIQKSDKKIIQMLFNCIKENEVKK